MTVLIVVESSFGTTMAVAAVLAAALRGAAGREVVTVVRTLQTPTSRGKAASKGAPAATPVGVREWVGQPTPRPDLQVVTVDISLRLRFSLGSAAKAACRLLRERGFTAAERGPSFYVTGTAGPLADGEQERASSWATQLEAGR